MMNRVAATAACALLAGLLLAGAAGAANVLVMNDVHYLPWYTASKGKSCLCLDFANIPCTPADPSAPNIHLGQIGCDSPLSLVQKAVAAAANLCPDPELVLVIGDSGGHGTNFWQQINTSRTVHDVREEVLSMIKTVTGLIHTTFPSAPTFITIGNDDVYPDYAEPDKQYLSSLAKMWDFSLQDPEALRTFSIDGFYRVNLTKFGVAVLMMGTNSVFAGNTNAQDCSNSSARGTVLFTWLENQLAQIKASGNTRAWIVGHIPPGLNHDGFDELWGSCFVKWYLQLLDEFNDVVEEQLFAHEHRALYKGIRSRYSRPVRVHPAVSPIYVNNPGFRCYHADDGSLQLTDYTDFVLHLDKPGAAFEPLFKSATAEYDMATLDPPQPYDFVERMINSLNLFALYWQNAVLGLHNKMCPDLDPDCVDKELCAFKTLAVDEFLLCVKTLSSTTTTTTTKGKHGGSKTLTTDEEVGIAVGAAAVLVLVCVAVVVVLKQMKRAGQPSADQHSITQPLIASADASSTSSPA